MRIEAFNIDFEMLYSSFLDRSLVVATHNDADGVYSAALLASAFNVDEVVFPDIFGDYNEEDVALDLGKPLNPEYKLSLIHI